MRTIYPPPCRKTSSIFRRGNVHGGEKGEKARKSQYFSCFQIHRAAAVRVRVDFRREMGYTRGMKLPFFAQLFKSLARPPETNPFPAPHLPPSVTDYLNDVRAGQAKLNPPVPFPSGGRARIAYAPAACIGCKLCIKVCPAHAIDFIPETKKIRIFRAQCIACGQCTEVCAKKCLSMDGEFLQADTDRNSPALIAE